jgi:energy-coupling factor transporter ATP-binding protein EcfA2
MTNTFGFCSINLPNNILFEVGQRVAIIGQNGIGKTTLLRTLVGELEADKGKIKWSENVNIGYYVTNTFGFCSINLPNNILPFSPPESALMLLSISFLPNNILPRTERISWIS